MKFFDTHAHLNIEPLLEKNEAIGKLAHEKDILINNVGVDYKTCVAAVELAEKYPHMFASIGIHPTSCNSIEITDELEKIEKLLANKKVIALGEIGLDYHYPDTNKEKQKECFIKQINLAKHYNKPIVIHVRDAHEDTQNILREHARGVKTIIHCFSGNAEEAKKYLELGCYISFSGIITFKNANELRDALQIVPLNKLLLETDCPWLSPSPVRGQTNTPLNVIYIYEHVANFLKIDLETLKKQLLESCNSIFVL